MPGNNGFGIGLSEDTKGNWSRAFQSSSFLCKRCHGLGKDILLVLGSWTIYGLISPPFLDLNEAKRSLWWLNSAPHSIPLQNSQPWEFKSRDCSAIWVLIPKLTERIRRPPRSMFWFKKQKVGYMAFQYVQGSYNLLSICSITNSATGTWQFGSRGVQVCPILWSSWVPVKVVTKKNFLYRILFLFAFHNNIRDAFFWQIF